jgi:hypothetical protein
MTTAVVQFNNSAERAFWQEVYSSCVRAGFAVQAAHVADTAVKDMTARQGDKYWAAVEHGA